MILTRSDKLDEAIKYCKSIGAQDAIVFGGEARLTDSNVKTLLNISLLSLKSTNTKVNN